MEIIIYNNIDNWEALRGLVYRIIISHMRALP